MDPLTAGARRPRLATVWLGGCSGCHMSFLDMDERLLDLAARVEIGATPLTDYKSFAPADVTLVEGAVANEEHLEQIRHVRRHTRVLVAFGDCAVTGNVTAMRDTLGLKNAEEVLQRAYIELADLNAGIPAEPGILPPLLERAVPLHEVVPVDFFLPGCPPSAERIRAFLVGLLEQGRNVLTGPMLKFG